jgi:hypothetical protein
LGVRVTSRSRENTSPASVPIDDHRNISLVKERVKPRLSFARAAMCAIEYVGLRGIDFLSPLWKVKNPNAPAVKREAAVTGSGGRMGLLRKMIAHYRMLRFLRWGRWRSAKATIRTFWNLYVGGRSLER